MSAAQLGDLKTGECFTTEAHGGRVLMATDIGREAGDTTTAVVDLMTGRGYYHSNSVLVERHPNPFTSPARRTAGDPAPYVIGQPLRYDLLGWEEPARPGLFWYSGFGLGDYYGADGKRHWLTTTEASGRAKADGVPFLWLDPMRLQPTPFTTNRGK